MKWSTNRPVLAALLLSAAAHRSVAFSASPRTLTRPSAIETKTTTTTTTTTTRELQERAAPIIASFSADDEDDFDPPLWLRNSHVQTIAGFLWREHVSEGSYVSRSEGPWRMISRLWDASLSSANSNNQETMQAQPAFWDHRERIETPDGDWFHADSKMVSKHHNDNDNKNNDGPPPTVLIVHGLESNTDSPAVKEMAVSFRAQGMNVVGLNFRGCSGTPNDTLGGYHLGFTDDLRLYLDKLVAENEGQARPTIYLAGFSLGANVVLKCLGELGAAAVTEYNIAGAAVLCAPLDQARNAPQLAAPGINRSVYSRNLLKTMKERVRESLDRFCDGDEETDKFDFQRCMQATTITEIDDAFIAPVYGFRDCWDYYQQTSSIHFLNSIAVPTLILNAEDDPFFDSQQPWPVNRSVENGGILPLKLIRTKYGGHLGYVWHRVESDDPRLLPTSMEEQHTPSWAAAKLGHFLGHVQEQQTSLIV